MSNKLFGKVSIVGVTDCGEKICSAVGRISTLSGNADEILAKSEDPVKNAKLIEKVTSSGHTSVTEHIYFNLSFCDVSVLVEQFMIEFRLAAYTVKSRRYVDFSDAGYCVPEFENENLREIFCENCNNLFKSYSELLDLGIKKEDARFVLPYSFRSNFLCSLDGRELLHVIEAMLYGRGRNYPEIRELGESLLAQAKKFAPGIYEKAFENKSAVNDVVDFSDICGESVSDEKQKNAVELISYSSDADLSVARAALVNYSGKTDEEIAEILKDEKSLDEVIKRTVASSRGRELEHISFTFRLNDISLASITHLVRHRIHSVNIPQLYNVNKKKYIIPAQVRENETALKIYVSAFEKNIEACEKLSKAGVDKYTLAYLDLAGNTLDVVSTMNGRQLVHFLCLRTCNRAQWEIREYAVEMLYLLRQVAPKVFSYCGPTCFCRGKCPEGRLTCGEMIKIKSDFSENFQAFYNDGLYKHN